MVPCSREDEAGPREDFEHRSVLGERLGHESVDVLISSARRQAFQEFGPDPVPLPGIGDDERGLGIGRCRGPFEAGHADDLTVDDRDERLAIMVIDGGEPLGFSCGQLWVGTEIPTADGLGRQLLVEPAERSGIGALDRPDPDVRTVAEFESIRTPARRADDDRRALTRVRDLRRADPPKVDAAEALTDGWGTAVMSAAGRARAQSCTGMAV